MARRRRSGDLAGWLADNGLDVPARPGTIADAALVRDRLLAAARDRRALSYSELLQSLGHRFTRPKMRALCRTLDAIDTAGAAAGEPALAVLVVRESDRLPGQGWWIGTAKGDYAGAWTGAEAAALVRRLQEQVFAWVPVRGPSSPR